MQTDDNTLSQLISKFESQFPGLAEQIRVITDQRLNMLLLAGIAEQEASSGNATT